jgi:hypothetical protein
VRVHGAEALGKSSLLVGDKLYGDWAQLLAQTEAVGWLSLVGVEARLCQGIGASLSVSGGVWFRGVWLGRSRSVMG